MDDYAKCVLRDNRLDSRIFRVLAFLLVIGMLLLGTGCPSTSVVSDTSEVVTVIEQIELLPGETSRTEVRGYFGEPLISDNKWKVELFGTSTRSTIWLGLLPPLPIGTSEFFGYLLVAYDDDGLSLIPTRHMLRMIVTQDLTIARQLQRLPEASSLMLVISRQFRQTGKDCSHL